MAFGEVGKLTLWIGGIGLVWNLLGLAAFVNQALMDVSSLPDAQRAFHEGMPLWAKTAFLIAVSMGVAGCIGLLIGQDWARIAFALSLLGIVLQNVHAFVLSNGLETFGGGAVVMPVLVFLVGVFLLYYSNSLVQ